MAVVLVVDDHRVMRDTVAALVATGGHEAETVHSGAAALEFIRAGRVDLVVLDVSMPGMSGLDVLRTLRADGRLPGLPVIMFSANDGARGEALRLGAADFVFKEDAGDLLGLVAKHTGPAAAGRS